MCNTNCIHTAADSLVSEQQWKQTRAFEKDQVELKWKGKNKAMHHLKLLKGKASPSPWLHVVLESLALHNGAKRTNSWAWEYLHSLLLTSCIQNIAGSN
jgi:hypothetical protein